MRATASGRVAWLHSIGNSMARIIDVANRAGVSIKTVSRVINDEPHVTDALRERVRQAAREVGYVPSTSARRLRSNRGYAIHMLSHSGRSGYVNAVQFGAVQACQDLGFQFMISLLPDLAGMSREALSGRLESLLKASRPDGVILVPPLSNDVRLNAVLRELKVQIARVGPNDIDDGGVKVQIDERGAARRLTEHLIGFGHRRIAFQRGPEDQNATHERFAGYTDALAAAGLPLDPDLVVPGEFVFASGLEAGDRLLARPDRPTAVFAANDDMAVGMMVAAHRLGLEIPRDVSIVGFDDSEMAERIWPALTTVRQPVTELGAVAARRLIERANKASSGKPAAPVVEPLPYDIVYRDSAGPAPTLD